MTPQHVGDATTSARHVLTDHHAGISLLTALLLPVMIGLVGIAVDMAVWGQTYSNLSLAASGAAMNAVKIAAVSKIAGNPNYIADGVTAGTKWFTAEIGATSSVSNVSNMTPTVTINQLSNVAVTASVAIHAEIKSIFGAIFDVLQYPVNLEADAEESTAPYLEAIFMLDNSGSMQIGATADDITKLVSRSPCDSTNALYGTSSDITTWINSSLQSIKDYQCSYQGGTYDGTSPLPACPVTAGPPLKFSVYQPITLPNGNVSSGAAYAPAGYSQTCKGILPKQTNGRYPLAGAPCAFACHWTNAASTDPRGGTDDLYGMARRNGITLRIDLVKNAANAVLQMMQTDNASLNTLSAGIYTFNSDVTQIYPTGCAPGATGCEAGNDFTAAQNLVGTPPTYPNVTDTGMLPSIGLRTGNNNNTALNEALATLSSTYLTKAGLGTTADAPRKALFLITDGLVDDPVTGVRQAIDPNACDPFKAMGYSVFVIYTPYYPLMETFYEQYLIPIVEGSGSNSIAYNLQACSSGSNYYAAATDQSSLTTTLLTFLQDAVNAPAIFIK